MARLVLHDLSRMVSTVSLTNRTEKKMTRGQKQAPSPKFARIRQDVKHGAFWFSRLKTSSQRWRAKVVAMAASSVFLKLLANKEVKRFGYGSAIFVIHKPSLLVPMSGTCDCPEYWQRPRFEDLQNLWWRRSSGRFTAKNLVGFFHTVPKAQNVTSHCSTLLLLQTALIPGHNHNLDRWGFSKLKGRKSWRANNRTRQVNLIRQLPICTFLLSQGRKFGRPKGSWSLRSLGGPPGLSLALEKLLQGVPRCPALTCPDCIQWSISCWFLRRVKS